jgi:hypothetical protein
VRSYIGTKNIIACKYVLAFEFEMKDLGMMHYFFGLEVWQRTDDIFMSQGKYIVEIFKKNNSRAHFTSRSQFGDLVSESFQV